VSTNGVITIGRQELYERVWATPMRTLAAEFGVSDVGLAKACERHRIPCPPRGYWAKKQHGKPTRRLTLPPCPDPALQTVTIHPPAPKPPEASNPTEPPLDPDLAAVLESVRKLPELQVASTLRHPHPLVEAVRTRFQGATPDPQNLVRPVWDGTPTMTVAVGATSVPRALRFLDALVKSIERVGGQVQVKKVTHGRGRETEAVFCGEGVPLRLRERYRQVAIPPDKQPKGLWGSRVEYVLTGEFILDAGPSYSDQYGKDGKTAGPIEGRLNLILTRLVEAVGKARAVRRKQEADRRRWEEQERLRREQVERERAERARVEKLLAEAEAWRRANDLRAYIAAVEEQASDREPPTDASPELARWLTWARELADRLDPVSSTLDRLLGDPQTHSANVVPHAATAS
jgi:hypothetical protein